MEREAGKRYDAMEGDGMAWSGEKQAAGRAAKRVEGRAAIQGMVALD